MEQSNKIQGSIKYEPKDKTIGLYIYWYYVLLCFNNTKQKSLMELKTIRSIKMKKVYKKLTEEQKSRGVVFSSCLSEFRTEQSKDTTHEVWFGIEEEQKEKQIKRLKNDKFFKQSHFKFNIIRT